MKLVKDLFYARGNKHLDIGRVMIFFSVLAFWAAVFYAIYQGNPFDPMAVGGGLAAIFTGGAGILYVRQSNEPDD